MKQYPRGSDTPLFSGVVDDTSTRARDENQECKLAFASIGLSLQELQEKLTYYDMDALSGVEQRTLVFSNPPALPCTNEHFIDMRGVTIARRNEHEM